MVFDEHYCSRLKIRCQGACSVGNNQASDAKFPEGFDNRVDDLGRMAFIQMKAALQANDFGSFQVADNQFAPVSADGALRKTGDFSVINMDGVVNRVAETSEPATQDDGCLRVMTGDFFTDLAGNIFYLMGVCNRLVRELGLSTQLKHEYETEINSANDYQSCLTVMQKWFGIVFINYR